MNNYLTVGQLRALLEDLPEDMLILKEYPYHPDLNEPMVEQIEGVYIIPSSVEGSDVPNYLQKEYLVFA